MWNVIFNLLLQPAQAAPDPYVAKRLRMDDPKGGKRRKLNEDEHLTQEERMKKSAAPYWNIPYPEQVSLLTKNLLTLLP